MTEHAKLPTILVVDDTEANVDILMEILGDDYEVSVAMDGQTALDAVAGEQPSLILLDIIMPGMDGYEVCRRLKANEKTTAIPVIFCTAKNEVSDEAKGFALGAVDYIAKPVSPPIVKARVATHLQLYQQKVTLAEQNQQLREYARLRDEVERITHHDLKSPLNAVLNVPGMIIEESNLTREQVEMLQMLEESGYQMLHIINSSMDMYKMELGKYEPKIVPVDVLKLVGQIRGEARELMRVKNLRVVVRLNGEPPREGASLRLPGEKYLLYSMLANLLKNAVEASPHGETISLDFETGNSSVIRIHNKGAVPSEIRDRFFEKFVSLGKQGGTGLGTYSASLIAKTLGGGISMATSEAQGTVLTIELPPPLKEEPPVKAEAKPKQQKRGLDRKMTILIADDYANMRRLVKSILRSMGFLDFREAENGMEAMNILSNQRIDLIISDINMPGMDGLSLLRNVRSSSGTKDIPFLIVSGEGGQELILEAVKYKVSDYILKPFTPEVLKKKMDNIFG